MLNCKSKNFNLRLTNHEYRHLRIKDKQMPGILVPRLDHCPLSTQRELYTRKVLINIKTHYDFFPGHLKIMRINQIENPEKNHFYFNHRKHCHTAMDTLHVSISVF